jgi:hypothetical protein
VGKELIVNVPVISRKYTGTEVAPDTSEAPWVKTPFALERLLAIHVTWLGVWLCPMVDAKFTAN